MNRPLNTVHLLRCYTSMRSLSALDGQQSIHNQRTILKRPDTNHQQIRSITRGRVQVLREMNRRAKDFDVAPHKLRHRREWLDWNYDCEIFAFNNRLKEKFDELTLKRAFIAKSHTDQTPNDKEQELEVLNAIELDNNEEFIKCGSELCDRFIPLYLRYFLRNVPEQGISAIKQFLLSTDPLSDMATKIGCTDLINCKDFPVEKETLADTMLSLIGALKQDTDEKHTIKFIIDFMLTYLYSLDMMVIWKIEKPEDVIKSILKTNGVHDFEYRILRQSGINTILSSYLIGVYCNKKLLGYGPGSTIGEGKEMAAYDCLRRVFNLNVANMVFEFGEKAYNLDYQKFEEPNQSIHNFRSEYLDRFK